VREAPLPRATKLRGDSNSVQRTGGTRAEFQRGYPDRNVHDPIDQVTTDPVEPVIIVTNPGRLWRTPCFAGTRVPVAVLLENLADGLTIDQIVDQYPSITTDVAIETLGQGNVLFNRAATPVLD